MNYKIKRNIILVLLPIGILTAWVLGRRLAVDHAGGYAEMGAVDRLNYWRAWAKCKN